MERVVVARGMEAKAEVRAALEEAALKGALTEEAAATWVGNVSQ